MNDNKSGIQLSKDRDGKVHICLSFNVKEGRKNNPTIIFHENHVEKKYIKRLYKIIEKK